METEVLQADAVAGRSLSGERDEWLADFEWGLERDQAGYPKHDGAWSLGGDAGTKAARTIVVEIGDFQDVAAAATFRASPETFRPWKRPGRLLIAFFPWAGLGRSLRAP